MRLLSRSVVAGFCLALASVSGIGSASADAIPYPSPGTQASAQAFSAVSTGGLMAYFYGSTASFEETLGLEVNGVLRAAGVLDNKATANGAAFDFGPVTAGDSLTFFINVLNTGDVFYSDPSRNADGINHVYSTAFSGDPVIATPGTFVGFEDLKGGGDLNYRDLQFVFTNTAAVSPVPLPASAPMFGAALLLLAAAGYRLRARGSAA